MKLRSRLLYEAIANKAILLRDKTGSCLDDEKVVERGDRASKF